MKPLSKEFRTWIIHQNKKLQTRDDMHGAGGAAAREQIFWQIAKLMEESGELSDTILAHHGLQRTDKTPSETKDAIALEVADVLIVTLLLAERLDIDVNNALSRKMGKIDKRFAGVKVKQ